MKEETKEKIRAYYKNEPKEKKEQRVKNMKAYHEKKKAALKLYEEEQRKQQEKEQRKQMFKDFVDLLKEKGYKIVKADNEEIEMKRISI